MKEGKTNWKNVINGFLIFSTLAIAVLSFYATFSYKFYAIVVTTIALIFLLGLTFAKLLMQLNSFFRVFFLGVFLFAISDAIFGSKKITEVHYLNLLFSSVFYNVGYFLICFSIIKKQNKIWK